MVEVSNAYNKISHAGLTAGKWLQAVRDIHPFFQNYKASDVANQLASLRRTLEKRKQKVGMMNSEETKLHSPKKQRVSGATAANNDPEQQNPLEFFLYRVLKFAENPISDDGNRVYGIVYLMPPQGVEISYQFGEDGSSIQVTFTTPKIFWQDLMHSSWKKPVDIREAFDNRYVKGLLDMFPADARSKSFTIEIGEQIQECPHMKAELLHNEKENWCYHGIPFLFKDGTPSQILATLKSNFQ